MGTENDDTPLDRPVVSEGFRGPVQEGGLVLTIRNEDLIRRLFSDNGTAASGHSSYKHTRPSRPPLLDILRQDVKVIGLVNLREITAREAWDAMVEFIRDELARRERDE